MQVESLVPVDKYTEVDMISKPTKAQKCKKVYYTHRIPPTYFGHSCGHLDWGSLQRLYISKYYRNF